MTQKQAEMQWNAVKMQISASKAAIKSRYVEAQAVYAETRRKRIADFHTEKEEINKERTEFVEKLHKLKRDGLSEFAEQLDAQRRLIAQCDKEMRAAREKFHTDLESIKTVERAARVRFENDIAAIEADGKKQQAEIFAQIEKSEKPTNPEV
ncbi:MAG: hypothetical protein J5826_01390 [Bacteroidales bacterium]|nr:hypothetical protein [Bacteroidales bacterium]